MSGKVRHDQIGMLGGGQLGRMCAQAALTFGCRTIALSPEKNPIIDHVAEHMKGHYEDKAILDAFLRRTAGANVTLEFENIPVATLEYLSQHTQTRPGVKALKIAQDRRLEKRFFSEEAGIPTTPFYILEQASDLNDPALDSFSFPAVLKTARDGYDGKGQVKVEAHHQLAHAWAQLNKVPCILESFVHFDRELSILVVRDVYGDCGIYGPFHNEHENHILATSWSGMTLPKTLIQDAYDIGIAVAEKLDYVGVLCVELFQLGDKLLVNEMAPRPHNSGHLTIETFTSSQFEQQVRATLGLPIAPVEMRRPGAMMNIVGFRPDDQSLNQLMRLPGVHWHWYAKDEVKPGRKMGHITLEANTFAEVQALHSQVKALIKNSIV